MEARRPGGLTGLPRFPNDLAGYPNETLEILTDGFCTSEITNGTVLFAIVYVGCAVANAVQSVNDSFPANTGQPLSTVPVLPQFAASTNAKKFHLPSPSVSIGMLHRTPPPPG